jgi:U3 small nucleolar ribonucleoprotein protein LCP5
MAIDTTPAGLLSSLTSALTSARLAIPTDPSASIEGISLLDVKNDLLLSYLQNLAFLVVIRLRHDSSDNIVRSEVIKKLVEVRVYLERGVRPLEGKLKYQIDKVVRAADEAVRRQATQQASTVPSSTKPGAVPTNLPNDSQGSEDERSEADEDYPTQPVHEPSVGPRAAALLRSASIPLNKDTSSTKARTGDISATGAYKPPRINPTTMPEPSSHRDRDEKPARKRRSQLLDEYIDEEISSAPQAQPSIGSGGTILHQGRGAMSNRDREKERERTAYEERNFTRLPALSKAERKKEKSKSQKDSREVFGGEDWTGLGGLGDRINRTVTSGRGRSEGVFERREKRKRDTVDGQRGDGTIGGAGIGDTFEKRRKVLQQRAEKKVRRKG